MLEFIYIIIVAVIILLVFIWDKKKRNKYKLLSQSRYGTTVQNLKPLPDQEYIDNYWIPVESNRRELNLTLFIKYQNTHAVISERKFDLTTFSRGEKGYHLHGFCHKNKRNITITLMLCGIQADPENIENVLEK